MLGVVKTRTIHGHCAKKNGTSFSGPAASIVFSISSWLRGVDLNHRPLGYEPNELPDCSTPHFDHNVCCICGQTTSLGNLPGGSNLVALGSAGLLIRTRANARCGRRSGRFCDRAGEPVPALD